MPLPRCPSLIFYPFFVPVQLACLLLLEALHPRCALSLSLFPALCSAEIKKQNQELRIHPDTLCLAPGEASQVLTAPPCPESLAKRWW